MQWSCSVWSQWTRYDRIQKKDTALDSGKTLLNSLRSLHHSSSQVIFLQKMLEYMLAQHAYFTAGQKLLNDLEPYMAKLFDVLNESRLAHEQEHKVLTEEKLRVQTNIMLRFDEDMQSVPDEIEKR